MPEPITWNDTETPNEPLQWSVTPPSYVLFTWDEVALIRKAAGDIHDLQHEEKQELIELILKVHGNTITERKQKEIKQYKIKAKDINIAVNKILGVEVMAENVIF